MERMTQYNGRNQGSSGMNIFGANYSTNPNVKRQNDSNGMRDLLGGGATPKTNTYASKVRLC
jgi:hypothetical protein